MKMESQLENVELNVVTARLFVLEKESSGRPSHVGEMDTIGE